MTRQIIAFTLSCCFLHFSTAALGQHAPDSIKVGDTTYIYKDDTLFSDKGFSICVGQTLFAGKGGGEDARYMSISFKSAFAFPLMFLRGTELKNNSDYESNPSLRDADKVKEYLSPGRQLIVKRIRDRGRKKKWHFFEVYCWDGKSSLALKYRCDIARALHLHEILLESPDT